MPKAPKETQAWWKDGVQFECQGSGRCCLSRGTHGYVYLTAADRKRLALTLKIPTREFTRMYCSREDGWYFIKPEVQAQTREPRPSAVHACRFLEGKRCAVYEGRPAQCRTWPFWPENMGAKAWDVEVVKFCPGIGKGKLYTSPEIKKLLGQDPLS